MFFNLSIGLIIIGITVTIHGYGSKYWIEFLLKTYYKTPITAFDKRAVRILIFTALFLLVLNFIEAIIWGFTYYLLPGVTEFQDLEEAIYFSLVTFTTLGYGDLTIHSSNRILSGIEAMNGVLLLGWSTTMMFSVMQTIMSNIMKKEHTKKEKNG